MRTCPNLLISIRFVNKREINGWEHVNLLGSMASDLVVAADMCYDEKCEEAISKCTNLESLTIDGRYTDEEQGIESSSDVTFLLSLSSPSLTNLAYLDFTATQQNVCALSSAFRNCCVLIHGSRWSMDVLWNVAINEGVLVLPSLVCCSGERLESLEGRIRGRTRLTADRHCLSVYCGFSTCRWP